MLDKHKHNKTTVDMQAAADYVRAFIAQSERTIRTIGITGPVGSGKSHLARAIAGQCDGAIISTDMYLPDYEIIAEHERDEPAHADYDRAAKDIRSLRDGNITSIPVWSFHTHARVGEKQVHPSSIVICEGIHALHAAILPQIDLAIFVDASSKARWNRWEHAERTGERGWGVPKAKAYFHTIADPTFAKFAQKYYDIAEIIVQNDQWRSDSWDTA